MSLAIKITVYSTLTAILLIKCGTGTVVKCPSPDNQTDAAESKSNPLHRPPSGISHFNVTSTGPNTINVSWTDPQFEFTATPCHFYLNISYTPYQKGSHLRTTHMNCDPAMRSASVPHLTPDTVVTIQLRTCLLLPPESLPENLPISFICTQSIQLTHKTTSNIDPCAWGYYTNATTGECSPCLCNGRSNICEVGTGICLACMDNSVGDSCQHCFEGYTKTPDNKCEQSRPSVSSDFSVLAKNTSSTRGQPDADTSKSLGSTSIGGVLESTGHPVNILSSTATKTTPPAKMNLLGKTAPHTIPLAIIITSTLIVMALITCVIVIIYRKRGGCRKKPMQFWTIQLQSDNQPTIAYSDITEPQLHSREDNKLIENDFTSRLTEQQFASDENPYRPITA